MGISNGGAVPGRPGPGLRRSPGAGDTRGPGGPGVPGTGDHGGGGAPGLWGGPGRLGPADWQAPTEVEAALYEAKTRGDWPAYFDVLASTDLYHAMPRVWADTHPGRVLWSPYWDRATGAGS